jgi:2OG-Fe(II) oxygenase superfamily
LKDIWVREGELIDKLEGDPCPPLPKDAILSKVRWVTLGYQYDWTARRYFEDAFVPFPEELAALFSQLTELVGHGFSLRPEAAIVNFYPVSPLRLLLLRIVKNGSVTVHHCSL